MFIEEHIYRHVVVYCAITCEVSALTCCIENNNKAGAEASSSCALIVSLCHVSQVTVPWRSTMVGLHKSACKIMACLTKGRIILILGAVIDHARAMKWSEH
jgi:hypothetical protein